MSSAQEWNNVKEKELTELAAKKNTNQAEKDRLKTLRAEKAAWEASNLNTATPSKSDCSPSTDCEPERINLCTPATTSDKHNAPEGMSMPRWKAAKTITGRNIDVSRVMTDNERKHIDKELEKQIPNADHRKEIYLALAMSMADIGTSPEAQYPGKIEIGGKCYSLDDIASIVQKHTTKRRFARFYAKVVYELMRSTNRPPDNWVGKGYPPEAKFAAFDFFDAISSNESMEPPGGIRYRPTPAELRINMANKQLRIRYRQAQVAIASTFGEISGGKVCMPALPMGRCD